MLFFIENQEIWFDVVVEMLYLFFPIKVAYKSILKRQAYISYYDHMFGLGA